MKYITIQNNKLHAFYDSEYNKNIPETAIEISLEEYENIKKDPSSVSFKEVASGVEITPIVNYTNLDDTKTIHKDIITDVAQKANDSFSAIQSEIYNIKYNEAINFIAGIDDEYPMLESEAQSTKSNKIDIANAIVAKRKEWISKAAMIEGTRIGYKKLITAAYNIEEVIDIYKSALVQFDNLK